MLTPSRRCLLASALRGPTNKTGLHPSRFAQTALLPRQEIERTRGLFHFLAPKKNNRTHLAASASSQTTAPRLLRSHGRMPAPIVSSHPCLRRKSATSGSSHLPRHRLPTLQLLGASREADRRRPDAEPELCGSSPPVTAHGRRGPTARPARPSRTSTSTPFTCPFFPPCRPNPGVAALLLLIFSSHVPFFPHALPMVDASALLS